MSSETPGTKLLRKATPYYLWRSRQYTSPELYNVNGSTVTLKLKWRVIALLKKLVCVFAGHNIVGLAQAVDEKIEWYVGCTRCPKLEIKLTPYRLE